MANRQDTGFFTVLPAQLRLALVERASEACCRDGEWIHRRGDTGRSLTVVRSGAVRMSNVGADGREVTLATLQPGESFGEFTLFANLPRQFDFRARGDTVLDVISHRQFASVLADHPTLSSHVISHLARRLYDALELIDDERRLPLVVRLAKLLARLADSDGEVGLTQQELADELAVSRISVSACLRKLRDAGLLVIGYGWVRVLDGEHLDSWVATQVGRFSVGTGS